MINKTKCCGCTACLSVCPKNAITMQENEEGFLQPLIDETKCIHCGLCEKICPCLHPEYKNDPNPTCLAVMAQTNIRMKSSSGGLFSLLAEYVLDKGGYVCGAAYDKNWTVHHIIIDNKKDLAKIRKSKYMQSRIEDCYKKIKDLLQKDNYVLFSGTPCQVAGLNKVLKKDYERLITIDVVCHGVPSPMVFKKFLEEHSNAKIKSVDFREKEILGWSSSTVIKYENGEVYRKSFNECPYFKGFLADIFLNKLCTNCPFNNIPRQADFTLGDFWKIHEYNKKLTDGKGTGIILLNTEKAKNTFNRIKKELTCCESVPLDFAYKSNPNLKCSFKQHPNRNKFFKILQTNSYSEALKKSMNEKFDICVVGLGFANNYGAALTNFALIKTLENLNYDIIMMDAPYEYLNETQLNIARRFAHKHFNMTKQYSLANNTELNQIADTFLIGSDQVWNTPHLKKLSDYFCLGFAHSNKKKIAYAASFGHDKLNSSQSEKDLYSYLFSRFDFISTRENSGLNILNELNIKAVSVLDPIFLCPHSELLKLTQLSKKEKNGKYIFSYILDPLQGNKKFLLEYFSKYYDLPLVNIVDLFDEEKHKKELGLPTEKIDSIEDFLKLLHNSEFIITDSYHGLCLSILFRKKFICIGNKWRGITRFEQLIIKLNLQDRFFYNSDDVIGKENILNQDINYDDIFNILKKEQETSLKFLTTALKAEKNYKTPLSEFDAINITLKQPLKEIHNDLMNEIQKLNTKINKLENNSKKSLLLFLKYKLLSKVTFGKMRKHYKRKYKELKQKIKQMKK